MRHDGRIVEWGDGQRNSLTMTEDGYSVWLHQHFEDRVPLVAIATRCVDAGHDARRQFGTMTETAMRDNQDRRERGMI